MRLTPQYPATPHQTLSSALSRLLFQKSASYAILRMSPAVFIKPWYEYCAQKAFTSVSPVQTWRVCELTTFRNTIEIWPRITENYLTRIKTTRFWKTTQCSVSVTNASVSYLGYPEFKSWPGIMISWFSSITLAKYWENLFNCNKNLFVNIFSNSQLLIVLSPVTVVATTLQRATQRLLQPSMTCTFTEPKPEH
jgi:hypothetical protein